MTTVDTMQTATTVSPTRQSHIIFSHFLPAKSSQHRPLISFGRKTVPPNLSPNLSTHLSTHNTATLLGAQGDRGVLPWYKMPTCSLDRLRQRYISFRKVYLQMTRPWRIYHARVIAYEKKRKRGLVVNYPPSPSPTPSLPPIREKPDFNGMDNEIPHMTHHFSCPPWRGNETIRIRRFLDNREISSDIPDVFPPESGPFSFSLVAVATFDLT